MKRLFFTETQKMSKWLVVAIPGGVILVVAILLLVAGPKENPDEMYTAIAAVGVASLVSLFFLLATRLAVRIDEQGIHYRYFPFHFKEYLLEWKEVKSAQVRQYAPVREFGGWGIRKRRGARAYNVRGNIGLELKLKDGNRILFGTQQGDELSKLVGYFPIS